MSDSTRATYLKGLWLAALGIIIISPDGLLMRLIRDAAPWDVAFWRGLFMGLSLSVVLVVRFRGEFLAQVRGLGRVGGVATVLMAGSNIGFVLSITHTSVANTLIILSTMPLFAAALGWFFIGEGVTRRTAAAVLIAIGGIAIIFVGSLEAGFWFGNVMALFTALMQGGTLVALRRARPETMLTALCVSGFLAAGISFPFAAPLSVTAHDLGLAALLGGLVIPLALSIFFSAVRYIPAAEAALISLLETVLGPLWAWLGVGEVPASVTIVGGVIVVGAIAGNALLGLRSHGNDRGGSG